MRRCAHIVASLVLIVQLHTGAVAAKRSYAPVQVEHPLGIRQAGATDPIYASLFSPTPSPSPSAKPNWIPPTPTASAAAVASPSPSASPSPEPPPSAATDTYDVYYAVTATSSKLSDNAVQRIRNESARAMGVPASTWAFSLSSEKASPNTSSGTVLHYVVTLPKNLAAGKIDKLTSFVNGGGLLTALSADSLPEKITTISFQSAPKLSSGSSTGKGSQTVGVVIGCLIGLILLAILAFFLAKFFRRRKAHHDSFTEKALNEAPPDFDESHFGGDVARTTSAGRVNPTGNPLDLSKQHRIAEWQEGASVPSSTTALAARKSGGLGSQRTVSNMGTGNAQAAARSFIAPGAVDGSPPAEPGDQRQDADADDAEHLAGAGSRRALRAGTGLVRMNSSSDYNESVVALSDYAGSMHDVSAGSFREPRDANRDGDSASFIAKPVRQGTRYPRSQDPSASFLVGRLHPGQHSGLIEPEDNKRYRR